MEFTVELPEKYAEKLAEVEDVDPSIRDQIEVETLPHVLRLINDAHRQVQDGSGTTRLDQSTLEDDS